MGRIPEEVISEVLSRADVLQVIGEYVQLKRAGAAYKGLCPFHNEKTPSFNVHPDRGFFKCFGCGEGGNLYMFLMKMEGWSFPESVTHLAKRVGVDIPEVDEEEAIAARKRAQARDQYQDILEKAKRWYERQLWQGPDPAGREYLAERGIDEETSRVFGLGYSPDAWTSIIDYLGSRKIPPELCERAGLAIAGGRSGHYDRFRARVMFPVVDIWGKTVAFGGRRLKDGEKAGAKYINSPETAFYQKGSELYGLAATKKAIRSEGQVVLVEGNFDVIALYAQGIKNAICPMGTALTDRQVRLMSRYSKKVLVAFDGDKAGRAAVLKSLPVLMEKSFDARVVEMPTGLDPDSFVRARGQEGWNKALGQARPIVAYAIAQVAHGVEGAPVEERVKVLNDVAEILQHVQDEITWRHYANEVARLLDIPLRLINNYLKNPERLREQGRAHARKAEPTRSSPTAPGLSDVREATVQESSTSATDASMPSVLEVGDLVAEPRPIPVVEAKCFQVLSDLPGKLGEFVDAKCCQLLVDERLVVLIERVNAQNLETGRPPEYSLIAEQVSNELSDQDFFGQISAILCEERAYDDTTIERTYSETVVTLQRRWLEREEKVQDRLELNVEPGSDAELEALHRRSQLIKLRRELDLRYQRKLARPSR